MQDYPWSMFVSQAAGPKYTSHQLEPQLKAISSEQIEGSCEGEISVYPK